MIIDNTRLPDWVEQGAQGGPVFSTQVNRTQGGQESTVVLWSQPLHVWDISYGITRDTFNDVRDFFYARMGRAYGFRFKDWSDYKITDGNIGTGDGADATWQIIKVYDDAVRPFSRKITRIVAGTLVVKVNGVTQTLTTDYTVNMNTGLITFTGGHIPAVGHAITVTCEFDVPVRFDQDELELDVTLQDVASIPSITVTEVRE